jgi:hypothetical protein
MNHSFTTVVFISLVLMSPLNSCRKWLAAPPPSNILTAAAVFSNDRSAGEVIEGLYSTMMADPKTLLNGALTIYPGLGGQEILPVIPSAGDDAFTDHQLTAANMNSNRLYIAAYVFIRVTNTIIEHVSGNGAISDSARRQLTGEARCLRGLLYFYLLNLYGDVPLVITNDYEKNALLGRTPVIHVYQQVVSDLLAAEELLEEEYVSSEAGIDHRTRPNRAAAEALLARVYLYQRNWTAAENMATAVINRGAYRLEALDEVFLSTSRETIWQLEPAAESGIYTTEGNLFLPHGNAMQPAYVLTEGVISGFEPEDARLSHWTAKVQAGAGNSYACKYKAADANAPHPEFNIVLRLAEQYLIRAEARYRLGDMEGASADLDVIRHRAGLPGTAVLREADLMTVIQRERRSELFAEWGHRWFDLKRWGIIDSVMSADKGGWHHEDALYPLPNTDLERNPNLWQNPGYQ